VRELKRTDIINPRMVNSKFEHVAARIKVLILGTRSARFTDCAAVPQRPR